MSESGTVEVSKVKRARPEVTVLENSQIHTVGKKKKKKKYSGYAE